MKTAIKNHKKKLSMSIQYGTDNLFYNIIFKKKEPVKTTQKLLDLIDKNPFITRQELSEEMIIGIKTRRPHERCKMPAL